MWCSSRHTILQHFFVADWSEILETCPSSCRSSSSSTCMLSFLVSSRSSDVRSMSWWRYCAFFYRHYHFLNSASRARVPSCMAGWRGRWNEDAILRLNHHMRVVASIWVASFSSLLSIGTSLPVCIPILPTDIPPLGLSTTYLSIWVDTRIL